MDPKSIAVTGANGQVGRSILATLAPAGVKVTALVRKPQAFGGCTPLQIGSVLTMLSSQFANRKPLFILLEP